MSTTTITYIFSGGDLTQLTSVLLASPPGISPAFGVQRQDTGAIVVASGQTPDAGGTPGTYTFTFTDPAPGLLYTAYLQRAYRGQTTYKQIVKAGGGDTLSRYCTLDEATTIAASLVTIPAWLAANSLQQFAALAQATQDIDQAIRYQGRRYAPEPDQVLEFPRVAYEHGGAFSANAFPFDSTACLSSSGDTIWDWDSVDKVAVVPQRVKIACVLQADCVLDGTRMRALDQIGLGLKSQTTGGMSESYGDITAAGGPVGSALCRRAYQIMQAYQLCSGKLL